MQFAAAVPALAGLLQVGNLVQLAARRAGEHVQRMARIVGDEIAGEKINVFGRTLAQSIALTQRKYLTGTSLSP